MRKRVTIYTDGACSGNPGPGGWGAVLLYGEKEKTLSGGAAETTNQRMELTAAIRALQALNQPCEIVLFSDSAYLVNAFNQRWLENWQSNGWKNAKKQDVENRELWQELLDATAPHSVQWRKVKGHAGDRYNELCDQLARKAINNQND